MKREDLIVSEIKGQKTVYKKKVKITQTMVNDINELLKNRGCFFIVEFEKGYTFGNPAITYTLPSMNGLDNVILNVTRDIKELIYQYLLHQGIIPSTNNTGDIIWSENGFDDNIYKEI